MSIKKKFETLTFRKSVSALLVLSQFCIGSSFAFADSGTASPVTSPEAILLQDALELQGSNLPQPELKKEFTDLIGDYLQTAPIDGRELRLEQALIGMHILTAQQVSALTGRISSDFKRNGADPVLELQNLFASPPAGAQFSFCDAIGVTFLAGVPTSIALAIASSLDHNNQTIDEIAVTIALLGFTVGMIGVGGC